jgi:hypothetical protein
MQCQGTNSKLWMVWWMSTKWVAAICRHLLHHLYTNRLLLLTQSTAYNIQGLFAAWTDKTL